MKRFACLLVLSCGCTTSATPADAGDADTDAGLDLCDLDRFLDSGGVGNPCPYANARLCFHNMTDCPTQGCQCAATSMGPRWKCTTDESCKDSGDESSTDASADAGTD